MTPDSHVVIVDPQARAKWGCEPLLVLTDSSEDGRSRSALMRPIYCCNEVCHCTEVEFEISLVDEPLAGVNEDDERIRHALEGDADEPPAVRLRLELQIGKFTSIWLEDSESLDEPGPDQVLRRGEGVSDEMIAWARALERCFDGRALDELWRRHLISRGRDPRQLRRRPPDDYADGTLNWSDVCPTARRDILVGADGTMTVAIDHYCANPKCTCAEAHVSFAEAEGSVGTVTVDFETDELRVAPEEGWSQDELQSRWDRYVERWPGYRPRLQERRGQLRAALHNAMQRKFADLSVEVTPRRRDAKVGRNAPCPCGSGRKYKRCCGKNTR
jgi:hypothetical protein